MPFSWRGKQKPVFNFSGCRHVSPSPSQLFLQSSVWEAARQQLLGNGDLHCSSEGWPQAAIYRSQSSTYPPQHSFLGRWLLGRMFLQSDWALGKVGSTCSTEDTSHRGYLSVLLVVLLCPLQDKPTVRATVGPVWSQQGMTTPCHHSYFSIEEILTIK